MVDLKKIREQQEMTQIQLGEKTGLSNSYISMIENKERRPSVDAAMRIAKALGFKWTLFFEK